jgi:putative ABC transport system permease protein
MRAGAALALVIAAVFVGSMLGRAVAEQRAELATLRAIGMPDRGVISLVLVQALLVAGAGTPIGAAIGHALGLTANLAYARWLDVDALYVPSAGLFALLGAVAVGLAVGAALLPARAALRIEPADALREA